MNKTPRIKKSKPRRVQAYLDGDPFHLVLAEGQDPVDTVCRFLKGWLGTDLTLCPVGPTTYRVRWYSAKHEQYKEAPVEIEPVK